MNRFTASIDYGRVEVDWMDPEMEPRMQAWVAFTVTALALAAILALFLPRRQLLMAILPIVAAELAAYFTWRRQAKRT